MSNKLSAEQIEEARHSLRLWFPNESEERKLFNRICDAARSETKLALESARLRDALAAIVSEADRNPFNPIGHVVEHVVANARAALKGTP